MVLWWLVGAHAEETLGSGSRSELPFEPPPSFRVVLDQRVQLPAALWFTSDFNRQARVMSYHLGLVLDCASTPASGRISLDCRVADAAIAADAFEVGVLPPILDEIDRKLTGARVTAELTREGRVMDTDLHEAAVNPRLNLRINRMHENLRLMVRKAVLGFEMPQDHEATASVWPTRRSDLAQTVSSAGTISRVQLVHELHPLADERQVVRSTGEGISAPAMGADLLPYSVRIESIAVYDPAQTMLTERLWTVTATPTASNPLAEGFAGVSGRVESALRVVAPTEVVELFPSIERVPVFGGAL